MGSMNPGLFPEDGLLVGSADILSQSNVKDPTTAVNQTIPTPSIYCDGRGEIHNIALKDDAGPDTSSAKSSSKRQRLNILYTRQGVMRSGDIHPNHQCDFVFTGCAEVWTLEKDGSTKKTTYGPKQYIEIPPYVPHVFNFIQDTIMAEWWEGRDGTSSNFRAWFYTPYRKIVDESFTTSSTRGRMRKFTELSDSQSGSYFMDRSLKVLAVGGIALGLSALSFKLGSRYGRKR